MKDAHTQKSEHVNFKTELAKTLLLPFILCVCCLLTILAASAIVTRKAYKQAENDMVIAIEKQAAGVKTMLAGQYNTLRSQAVVYGSYGLSSDINQKSQWLTAIKNSTDFSHVLLVDDKGVAISETGAHLNIWDRGYFQAAIHGARVFQHLNDMRLDGECNTVIGVPVRQDDQIVAVLLGLYKQRDIRALLMSATEEEEDYTAIIDGDGNIITASDEITARFVGNNAFEGMSQLHFGFGRSAEDVLAAFQRHETKSFDVHFQGKEYYIVAQAVTEESLRINNWYILNIVPTEKIKQEASDLTEAYSAAAIIVMLLSLALITYVELREKEFRARIREESDELRMQREAYSVAARQSEQYVLRYYFSDDNIMPEDRLILDYGNIEMKDIASFVEEEDFFAEESKKAALDFYALLKSGATSGKAQLRMLSPTAQEYRLMAWEFTTIFDKDEQAHHSIIVFHDITEERLAEERYHALATQADAFYEVRTDSALLNLSRNRIERLAEKLKRQIPENERTDADAMLAALTERFVDAEDRERYRDTVSRLPLLTAFRNGESEISEVFRFIEPDGNARWRRVNIRMAANPTTDEAIAYLWTEDVHAEHQLTALLNTLVTVDYDFVLLMDRRSSEIIKAVSQDDSFSKEDVALGYDEILRRRSRALITSEDQERVLNELKISSLVEALKERERCELFYDVRGRDGAKLHKKTTCFYLDAENQNEIVITRVDLTEAVQEQQRENDVLSTALAEAEKATAAKSEFLSRISHDMRTPMNAVLGFADLGAETQDVAELKDYMKKIGDSGRYLLTLINDTLSMTKIESGSLTLEYAPTRLSAIEELVNSVIRPKAEEKGVRFETEIEGLSERSLMMDCLRMEQILVNLLGNAVKFTPMNGLIKLSVKALAETADSIHLRYIVSDNGVGMSQAFQDKMYKPFEQEHASAEGTGLGLSIAKQLVEMMGGTIAVQSAPGKGTTFTIDIEYRKSNEQVAAEEKIKTDMRTELAGMRVLLAEDHPVNVIVARKMLERRGASVEVAENGQAAIERFAESAPGYYDLILMDIRMPVMDGITATKAIRAMARRDAAEIPIIAMTANAFDEDMRATKEAGMNDHLSKPIETAKFYALLGHYYMQSAKKK